jgi:hypothetical protein
MCFFGLKFDIGRYYGYLEQYANIKLFTFSVCEYPSATFL